MTMTMTILTVYDGTDAVTLTGNAERWLVEVDLAELGDSGKPTDERGTPDDRARRLLEAATHTITLEGGGRLEYWVEKVDSESDAVATRAGFVPWRDLLRLRRELPALPTELEVRSYTNLDTAAFLEVNNRAFDWHPEQGNMTPELLAAKQAEPWYDPDGFLVLEEQGSVIGFCWTKVHADQNPALGEIYAIAVDPDHHGRGLGRELTLAGLAHLSELGLRHAILFVESDNRPALRIYQNLGFEVEFTNRAYQRFVR